MKTPSFTDAFYNDPTPARAVRLAIAKANGNGTPEFFAYLNRAAAQLEALAAPVPESPTPWTDAHASEGWSGDADCVSATDARELEMRLNAVVAALRVSLANVEGRIHRYPAKITDSPELLALRKERDILASALEAATTIY